MTAAVVGGLGMYYFIRRDEQRRHEAHQHSHTGGPVAAGLSETCSLEGAATMQSTVTQVWPAAARLPEVVHASWGCNKAKTQY